MTSIVFRSPAVTSGSRSWRFVTQFGQTVARAISAARTRYALEALSDDQLRDNGLTRSDIPFVAASTAAGTRDATRDPLDRLNRNLIV